MKIRKYLEFLKIGFKESTAYRFDAAMSLISSVFYLIMVYAIWHAIAQAGTLKGGLSTVISYILIGQIVSNSVFVNVENFFNDRIREGTIVNELKRPASLRLQVYFNYIGKTLFDIISKGVPIAVIGFLFLGLKIPSTINLLGFLVSLFLSFTLVFSFSYLTSMIIFWTKIGWGIRAMRSNIQRVFSGVLFPLYLLPDTLKTVFNYLPFQAMADGPISIFMMEKTGMEILNVYQNQIFWIIVLLIGSEIMWRKAKTKLTVQGG
ncbi:MAG: ABC transporter permease [Candidatus Nanohaloarchaea archaeon]